MSPHQPGRRRERVVVVGAGMVGHRFVEELVRRDAEHRFEVHLLGAEDYAPYNRILLSDVLAGRCDLAALALPEPDPDRVSFHRGDPVIGLDRAERLVERRSGERLRYDRLVLATGARAFVPPVPGLANGLPQHAYVLRTLDDCREIAARALNARHAVVLGGGLLGLEAACGLTRRGVAVTVVHLAGHLAQTQLDAAPANVVADTLADLGVEVRTAVSIAEVGTQDGVVRRLLLDDGTELDCDLLLLSCGVRPRDDLAAVSGLPVRGGVVVDDSLHSPDDPRVAAIGDCAVPPEGCSGLVAPGWEQATRLAAGLVGDPLPRRPDHDGAPVRLKAAGVDLVTMGARSSTAGPLDRVVSLHDAAGRRHIEVVVREGRLVGATSAGAPELASALTLAYDRGTPVPTDPLALLLPEQAEAEGSPALMPSHTPVCRCNAVAKRDIVEAWDEGARSLPEVAARTRATTGCGGCRSLVCGLVDWLRASDPDGQGRPAPGTGQASSQPCPQHGEPDVRSPQHVASVAETHSS